MCWPEARSNREVRAETMDAVCACERGPPRGGGGRNKIPRDWNVGTQTCPRCGLQGGGCWSSGS